MPEFINAGQSPDEQGTYETVCIHTRKIYDSCRDKDCVEDLRFFPTAASQETLNRAQTVKGGRAELLYTYIDVEPVAFNRGFYTIDMRYFYRVTLNAYCSSPRRVEVEGLCVFDKRVILFGSEGSAKIFSSQVKIDALDHQLIEKSNLPIAVVESVDPIVLDAKLLERGANHFCDCDICEIPDCICRCFASDLTMGEENRRVLVTLGQFSIVRLERDSQLLIPVLDYCLPDKECTGGCGGDPCDLFQRISFPVEEFFPPNAVSAPGDYEGAKHYCTCHG